MLLTECSVLTAVVKPNAQRPFLPADETTKETTDKLKDDTEKPGQNSGKQQSSLQHTADTVQLPYLAETSGKPETVAGPEVSAEQQCTSSPKSTNILPPIM